MSRYVVELCSSKIFWTSCLVTAATILGVGVLALPVKLAHCGFAPFLSTFLVALACQSCTICFLVELLQRTEAKMLEGLFDVETTEMESLGSGPCPVGSDVRARKLSSLCPAAPGQQVVVSAEAGTSPEGSAGGMASREWDKTSMASDEALGCEEDGFNEFGPRPNLHCMALHFIPNRAMRGVFDFCVFIHFIIVMVAYAIAATNALHKLTEVDRSVILIVFSATLSFIVVCGDRVLTDGVALLTVVKGTLLTLVILVSCYVAFEVQHRYANEWSSVGEAFLIGTVSLGGSVNVLPVVYSSFQRTPHNVRTFRAGCLAGTALCFVLNVTWCLCLLSIVPQQAPGHQPSLERALQHHDISTIPLLQFLTASYPQFQFIGVIVNVFIIISVTVSYVAMGLGMKHYLDGAVQVFMAERNGNGGNLRLITYTLAFGLIFTMAFFFAKSLYIILDVFNSAFLNLETGVFISYMVYRVRFSPDVAADDVPVQLSPSTVEYACALTFLYFGGAVVYDLVEITSSLVQNGRLQ